MAEYILLAGVVALVIGLLLLRTHTAICFLALCAGSVLLGVSGDNVGLVASSLTSGMSSAAMVARIVLLFVPLTVCAVLLRGYLSKGLLPLAFIPAVCTALLGVIMLAPLLPAGAERSIASSQTWDLLRQYHETVVGVGLVASTVLIAMTIKRPHSKHKKHR